MDLSAITDWIMGDATEIAALLREADSDEPVATCPGWTAADLSGHLATAYGAWYPYNISTPVDQWTPDGLMARMGRVGGGGHQASIADFEAGVAEFMEHCSGSDLDTPTWAFGSVKPARWWIRRAGTELTVHLTDAASMRDRDASTNAECHSEAIDEVLTEVFPILDAMKAVASSFTDEASAAATPPEKPVVLIAEDTERTWTLERGSDGSAQPSRGLTVDAAAVGKGSSSDVLAWLHGRPLDVPLRVEGDSALLEQWNLFHRSQF
jgi:hypothetical protein